MTDKDKKELFAESIKGKKLPILTLDHKWYRLLNKLERERARSLEDELNLLLKRQGKVNTETKEIKKIKRKLMNEIVPMVDEAGAGDKELEKKIDEHKRLIEECNEKLDSYQEEILELPREINRVNNQLMLLTMEYCYDILNDNTKEINEIEDWITQIRITLKKNIIKKQEMEQKNHDIYTYMNDIFGPDVVNLFDIQLDQERQHPDSAN